MWPYFDGGELPWSGLAGVSEARIRDIDLLTINDRRRRAAIPDPDVAELDVLGELVLDFARQDVGFAMGALPLGFGLPKKRW